MAGIITGAVISAGAGLIGSSNSARASRDAANTQAESAREANELSYKISQEQLAAQRAALDQQIAAQGATVDKQLLAQREALTQQLAQNAEGLAFQRQMYEQSRADFAPYRESGVANLNQLNTLLGIGGDKGAANYGRFATADFTNADFLANKDPGYGFRMSEGLKAVDRQAAARGGLISGNALKASQTYGQDMASQEYNNAFNRYQTVRGNTLQPFQVGAAAGQSAAAMQGQANANFGTAGAQALGANSAAYGAFGQGASGAYGAAGGAANQAYGAYGQGVTGTLGAYGTNATNALTNGANARASGIVGGANAFNQGLGGVSNLANTYYLNSLLQGRNSGGSPISSNGGFGTGSGFGNQDYGQYF